MFFKKHYRHIISAALAILVSAASCQIIPAALMEERTPASVATDAATLTVPGEIIVVCEPQAGSAEQAAEEFCMELKDTAPVESVEQIAGSVADDGAGLLLQLEEDRDLQAALDELNQREDVAYAQPNFRYQMLDAADEQFSVYQTVLQDSLLADETETDDPLEDLQYYLDAWDPSFQTGCGANVTGAWQLLGGRADDSLSSEEKVTIAVLDSGCQISHEDLSEIVDAEHAYDAVTMTVGADQVEDQSGHGTHVCGIAAAAADNGKGIAGAAGNYARILPINVFVGKYAETKNMIHAFSYLEMLMDTGELQNLHVINMSLGGYGETDEYDVALEQYISRMREKDVLTVCAGGNGDDQFGIAYQDNPVYPGDFEPCLCVTSLDSNGANSSFSDFNMQKDISAPGSGILSTMIDGQGEWDYGENAMYGSLSGTSMASPLVAGIASLLWADNDQLTADQVFEALLATAVPVNPNENDHTGVTGSAGAVDAAAAINYARDHFDDVRHKISGAEIMLEQNRYEYNGSEKVPAVTVKVNGKELAENTDYILSYRNNVLAGTASVSVTGITDYIGSVTLEYEIFPADIENAAITLIPETFDHDGAYHFPSLQVSMNGTVLKWGRDFTPTALSDGKKEGRHGIRIDGKGNYGGTTTVYYTIGREQSVNPEKPGSDPDNSGEKPSKPEQQTGLQTGAVFTQGKFTYQVTSTEASKETVKVTGSTASGKASIPAVISKDGRKYRVTAIGANAFRKNKRLKQLTVPAGVESVGTKAFSGCRNLKTLVLATGRLSKAKVKNCLKGSSIKTIRVQLGNAKKNKACIRRYKKFFSKANAGRKADVK